MYGKGSSSMEVFQSSGFRDWKNAMGNKRGVILCHQNSQAHMKATLCLTRVLQMAKQKTFVLVCLMHMRIIWKRNREIF